MKLTQQDLIINLVPPKYFAEAIEFYVKGVINKNGLDEVIDYKILEVWNKYEESNIQK